MRKKNTDSDFNRMTDAELIIMQGLWDLEREGMTEIHAGDLIERFPDTIGVQKLTTVLTLLTRLSGRGYVGMEKCGRGNRYFPLITEEEYRSDAAADFVSSICRSSRENLLSALVDGGFLSDADLDELHSLLKK